MFKDVLACIDSNEFSCKNEMGEFMYTDIEKLVSNIRNNTISEIDAKKCLNALKEITNTEIKYKRLIPKLKELLNLFSDLDTILTDKTLKSEDEKVESRKEEKEKAESRKEEDEYENKDEDYDNKNEYEYDDETMNQNEIIKKEIIVYMKKLTNQNHLKTK